MALLKVPAVKVPAQRGVGRVLLVNLSDLKAADPKGSGRAFFPLDSAGLMFGCNLTCPKTGRRAVYAVVGKWTNEDGHVAHIDLLPTPHTLRHRPELARWAVRVFNDLEVKPRSDDDLVFGDATPDGNNP